jgi:hypothetical protein
MIPILAVHKGEKAGNTLALAGEYTAGKGYGDQFPSWTGGVTSPSGAAASDKPYGLGTAAAQPLIDQGIVGYDSKTNALTFIELQTYNVSLQYHFPETMDSWMTLGLSQVHSKNVVDLTGGSYDNVRNTFVNFVHNFNPEMRLGVEYLWDQTHYIADNSHAQNNRVQLSTWYLF